MRMQWVLMALFGLALAGAGSAMAQQGGDPAQQGAPGMELEDLEVSDAELESVANAYVSILDIRDQYQPSLAEAEDADVAEEIQREANERMIEAVEAEGLDVETYNRIVMAAEGDETLRERLFEKIDEVEQ